MKILLLFGTRPEAIKMAPLVYELRQRERVDFKVCVTAQHRELLDSVLGVFDVKVDYDLNIMKHGQSLQSLVIDLLPRVMAVMRDYQPDYVLVHGDTATTFISSLAAFYLKIPVGHVEAGLRTYDLYSPWPEEANRRLTSVLTSLHFAPTQSAYENLVKENVSTETIVVTGNTVIDALLLTVEKLKQGKLPSVQKRRFDFLQTFERMVLVTVHRRENHGAPLEGISEAILQLSQDFNNVAFVVALHPNPIVQSFLRAKLQGRDNVFLLPPQDYLSFVFLMTKAYFILSDSGGIQEEAPSLGKPVLVLRDTTERPEALEAGATRLVGKDTTKIVEKSKELLTDPLLFKRMSEVVNPYGDGKASKRIIDFLCLKQHI